MPKSLGNIRPKAQGHTLVAGEFWTGNVRSFGERTTNDVILGEVILKRWEISSIHIHLLGTAGVHTFKRFEFRASSHKPLLFGILPAAISIGTWSGNPRLIHHLLQLQSIIVVLFFLHNSNRAFAMRIEGRGQRAAVWGAVAAVCVILMLVTPKIPQDQKYHQFADKRNFFGQFASFFFAGINVDCFFLSGGSCAW